MTPQNKEKLELLASWSGSFFWFWGERELNFQQSQHQGTERRQPLAPARLATEYRNQALVRDGASVLQVHTDQATECEEQPSTFVAI